MYKQRRKPKFPRPKRLIALDLETGAILQVEKLDFDKYAPRTEQSVLMHKSFYPRYGEHLEDEENRNSISCGFVYQEIRLIELFLTNSR